MTANAALVLNCSTTFFVLPIFNSNCSSFFFYLFMSFYPDEFIVETVVSNNEILSDDSSTTHSRPFGEPSFSAIVSKGTTVGLHNAYIAVGTFATAIFIVAMVVSTCVDRRPSNLFCRIEFMSMTDVDVQYPFPTRPCRLLLQLIHVAHFCLSSMPFFFRSAVATEH